MSRTTSASSMTNEQDEARFASELESAAVYVENDAFGVKLAPYIDRNDLRVLLEITYGGEEGGHPCSAMYDIGRSELNWLLPILTEAIRQLVVREKAGNQPARAPWR